MSTLQAVWPLVLWAVGTAAASWAWGWRGALMAVSAAVLVMLLQFHASLRVMQRAARAPVGQVPSAVALHAKLHLGMTMLAVMRLTRSLGRRVADAPPTWVWADPAGDTVTAVFAGARLQSWALARAAQASGEGESALPTPCP